MADHDDSLEETGHASLTAAPPSDAVLGVSQQHISEEGSQTNDGGGGGGGSEHNDESDPDDVHVDVRNAGGRTREQEPSLPNAVSTPVPYQMSTPDSDYRSRAKSEPAPTTPSASASAPASASAGGVGGQLANASTTKRISDLWQRGKRRVSRLASVIRSMRTDNPRRSVSSGQTLSMMVPSTTEANLQPTSLVQYLNRHREIEDALALNKPNAAVSLWAEEAESVNHDAESAAQGGQMAPDIEDRVLERIRTYIGLHGFDVNGDEDEEYTPVIAATWYRLPKVVNYLLESDANIDARTQVKRRTALLVACMKGDLEIAQSLVAHGASIYVRDYEGFCAMHLACQNGHVELVRWLVELDNERSADAEMRSQHESLLTIRNTKKRTPIFLACEQGHANIVHFMLETNATLANGTDKYQNTPLHLACEHVDVIDILLDKGAMVDADNKAKRTPLMACVEVGNYAGVERLCKRGASITRTAKGNETLAHVAASRGHAEILKFLVKRNIDVTAMLRSNDPLEDGMIPLDWALYHNHLECVEILLGHYFKIELSHDGPGASKSHQHKELDIVAVMRKLYDYDMLHKLSFSLLLHLLMGTAHPMWIALIYSKRLERKSSKLIGGTKRKSDMLSCSLLLQEVCEHMMNLVDKTAEEVYNNQVDKIEAEHDANVHRHARHLHERQRSRDREAEPSGAPSAMLGEMEKHAIRSKSNLSRNDGSVQEPDPYATLERTETTSSSHMDHEESGMSNMTQSTSMSFEGGALQNAMSRRRSSTTRRGSNASTLGAPPKLMTGHDAVDKILSQNVLGYRMIDIAVSYRRKVFIGSELVQEYLMTTWTGGHGSLFVFFNAVLLAVLGPVYVAMYRYAMREDSRIDKSEAKVPVAICFWAWFVQYITFSILVIPAFYPIRGNSDDPLHLRSMDFGANTNQEKSVVLTRASNAFEFAIFVWLVGLLSGEMQRLRLLVKHTSKNMGFFQFTDHFFSRGLLNDAWELYLLLLLLFAMVTAVIRIQALYTKDVATIEADLVMRSICACLFWIYIIRALSSHQVFGVLLHSIQCMISDIFNFLLLLALIVIAFSRAFVTLFKGSNNPVAEEAFKDVFAGCRALVEVAFNTPNAEKVNEVLNRVPETGEYELWISTISDTTLATAWTLQITYQLITNVMMLTLLIAMLSRTFTMVDAAAAEASMFERTQLMLSGGSRAEIQPPYNLLAIMWDVLVYVVRKAGALCGCLDEKGSPKAKAKHVTFGDDDEDLAEYNVVEPSKIQNDSTFVGEYLHHVDDMILLEPLTSQKRYAQRYNRANSLMHSEAADMTMGGQRTLVTRRAMLEYLLEHCGLERSDNISNTHTLPRRLSMLGADEGHNKHADINRVTSHRSVASASTPTKRGSGGPRRSGFGDGVTIVAPLARTHSLATAKSGIPPVDF